MALTVVTLMKNRIGESEDVIPGLETQKQELQLFPLQRQGSNLGCVNIKGDENQQAQTFRESARPGPAPAASGSLCLVHREDKPLCVVYKQTSDGSK